MKRLAIGMAVCIGLLLLAGIGLYVSGALSALGFSERVIDTVPPTLSETITSDLTPAADSSLEVNPSPPWAVKILLFSKTAGFRHEEAIPACRSSVLAIAARRGWKVFDTENAAVFNDEQLAHFDVIFGNNTTGDNWTENQKQAFIRYMETGGGFVGVHGAAGTRYRFWDWYNDSLLRALFIGHPLFPQLQTAIVEVEDRAHPATRHLPRRWERIDEWYTFAQSPRELGVRVLATLDESSYSPKAIHQDLSMGDHPIVWSHCVAGRGRAFYSALGHSGEAYADPAHEAMLEGALEWAAGLKGDCSRPS